MPDRKDFLANLFGTYPQKDIPAASAITDDDETTVSGHYADEAALTSALDPTRLPETDPVFAEPEAYLAGYLAQLLVVSQSLPIPAGSVSYPLLWGAGIVTGLYVIPSAACTLQLFDGLATARPLMQVPVPATGLAVQLPRVLFPHGLTVASADGTTTLAGSVLVERRVDSIPT